MVTLSPLTSVIVASVLISVSVSAYLVINDDDHDITIAWANKDCYEPFWIADALGYWVDEGVKVNGVILNNGSEVAASILSGNADIGGMGADPLLRMLRDDSGSSIVCRYQTGYSNSEFVARDGGNGGKISLSEYQKQLADAESSGNDKKLREYLNKAVKGAKVGMQVGTAYWSWFLGFLDNIELTADDVTIVPLDFNVQVAALTEKQVDIISGGSPNTELALEMSGSHFMISDPDQKLASIFLMASGNAMAAKADAIVKVLKGLQRACDLIYSDPENAAKLIIDVYGRNWTVEQQKTVFGRSIWGIDIVDKDIKALETAAKLINKAGQERKGDLPTGDKITERIPRNDLTDLISVVMDAADLPTPAFIKLEKGKGLRV
ncbi:MAG: ABC transporter substrate-binding protein [Methanomassiliicoccaceae archaeon]|nr:ABC transporter substrate-binding protein [Methanomassiliicoccaceae archaeon]